MVSLESRGLALKLSKGVVRLFFIFLVCSLMYSVWSIAYVYRFWKEVSLAQCLSI